MKRNFSGLKKHNDDDLVLLDIVSFGVWKSC